MAASDAKAEPARPRRRRGLAVAVGAAVVVCAAFSGLYAARDALAERFAQDWLAQRHVPGAFQIRSLSMTGLTARVRLGPKDDPDLMVDRLEVDYALAGPWTGRGLTVQTRAVRLVRPRLKARLADGKLDLGSLEPLLRELSRRPAAAGPPPDIAVEDGTLQLATPAGPLTVIGGGAMTAGVLARADARLGPFALDLGGVRARAASGTLHLARSGARLAGSAEAGALTLVTPGGAWRAEASTISADLPAPGADGRLVGPARITASLRGLAGGAGAARAERSVFDATFAGAIDAGAASQAFNGSVLADIAGEVLSGRGEARLELSRARLWRDGRGLFGSADGRATLQLAGGKLEHAAIENASAKLTIDDARLAPTGFNVRLHGSTSGRGGADAAAARRLAAAMPLLAAEPGYRTAAERALTAFHLVATEFNATVTNSGATVALTAPATLESSAGARLSLTSNRLSMAGAGASGGATRILLGGGGLPTADAQIASWRSGPADSQADLTLASSGLNLPFAEGLSLKLAGRLSAARASVRFDAASCAEIAAQRVPIGDSPATDVAGKLCPSGSPLIEAAANGWRLVGRFQAARASLPSLAAEISSADGRVAAAGSGGGLQAATVTVDSGRLSDTSPQTRFNLLNGAGRLELASGVWQGNFAVATTAGRPIGRARLRHDVASGVGRVDIDARGLVFAPGAIQPAEITPTAAFLRQASGAAGFTGWFAWAPKRPIASGGELIAHEVTFKSPAGPVLGLDTDLRFSSLVPLVSVEDQTVAVREVQALMPLTTLAATFDFDAKTATIDAAGAGFAQGQVRLEPMRAPLAADSTYRGVLVFDHVNLGQIIAASNLSHVMSAQAVVNARIPFEIGPSGVHITGGRLSAAGPGRLSIDPTALGGVAVGAVSAKGAAPHGGLAQDLAYQAMDNLAFDTLDAQLNSIAGDRLSILFHIMGRHDPPKKVRAQIAVSDLLAGRALSKPLPLPSGTEINLTLDSTLNFGELVRSLEAAWRESLGAPRSVSVQAGHASMAQTRETGPP
jgi:hypothetical protein